MPIAIVYDGADRPRRPESAAERLSDRPDEPRHCVPLRRVPRPQEAEGGVPDRRHRATAVGAGRRSTARSAENPAAPSSHGSRSPRRRPISRRRSSRRGAPVRPLCSSGPSPPAIAEAVVAARSVGVEGADLHAAVRARIRSCARSWPRHPDWLDGLTFAAGRMTAEAGPGPVPSLPGAPTRTRSVPQKVGVKARRRRGRSSSRPTTRCTPTTSSTCSRRRSRAAQSVDREKVLNALNQVSVEGANGDQRGFNEDEPRGRGRRRRLLRALLRHGLSPGEGRRALVDAAADRPGRVGAGEAALHRVRRPGCVACRCRRCTRRDDHAALADRAAPAPAAALQGSVVARVADRGSLLRAAAKSGASRGRVGGRRLGRERRRHATDPHRGARATSPSPSPRRRPRHSRAGDAGPTGAPRRRHRLARVLRRSPRARRDRHAEPDRG